jgi:hypothetical protein
MTAGRATALAIKEANRLVTVREGDNLLTMPAIQAVLRSQAIEREIAVPTHEGDLRGGLAERLDAALKRVGKGTDDQVGSSRGASHTAAARSARTR